MRLCVLLALVCTTLSGVGGLQCFTCFGANVGTCSEIWNCPRHYDRCATTLVADNLITKECTRSDMCNIASSVGMMCCSGDLCNGAQRSTIYSTVVLGLPLMAVVMMHI